MVAVFGGNWLNTEDNKNKNKNIDLKVRPANYRKKYSALQFELSNELKLERFEKLMMAAALDS
jgi:hypothetical protein